MSAIIYIRNADVRLFSHKKAYNSSIFRVKIPIIQLILRKPIHTKGITKWKK